MKYNIGDIFIDRNLGRELRCYLYNIDEYNGITYYWLEYITEPGYKKTYWTEEDLDEIQRENNVEHIPVDK